MQIHQHNLLHVGNQSLNTLLIRTGDNLHMPRRIRWHIRVFHRVKSRCVHFCFDTDSSQCNIQLLGTSWYISASTNYIPIYVTSLRTHLFHVVGFLDSNLKKKLNGITSPPSRRLRFMKLNFWAQIVRAPVTLIKN